MSDLGRVLPELMRQKHDFGFTADKRTLPTVKMGGEQTSAQARVGEPAEFAFPKINKTAPHPTRLREASHL
jgi:hypothetical protein